MTEGLCVIRTPNRGVAMAGAALGSVSLAVGVLGVSAAQASSGTAAPALRTVVVAPNSQNTVVTKTSQTSVAAAEQREAVAAERASISEQASAVAAAAGSTKTAKPKPKHKAKPKAARAKKRTPLTAREVAQQLVSDRGWKAAQFTCLDKLWTRESGWDPHEENGGSGAYGIPQSLPGRKMASFGADWRSNPVTQIKWGLWYIADRYSTPCAAWAHSERYNYY
jgi:hypothetical protein